MKGQGMKAAGKAAQHTPGPWKVSPPLGPGDFAVLSERVNAYGNFYVAVIPNGAHAEAEANARLIAAAPRMLDLVCDLHAAGSLPLGSEKRLTVMGELLGRARAILHDVQGGE